MASNARVHVRHPQDAQSHQTWKGRSSSSRRLGNSPDPTAAFVNAQSRSKLLDYGDSAELSSEIDHSMEDSIILDLFRAVSITSSGNPTRRKRATRGRAGSVDSAIQSTGITR